MLFFKKGYTTSMRISFCGEVGIRIDRVIQAEILDHKMIRYGDQTLKFGHKYRISGDVRPYRADFKFDVAQRGKA